MDDKLDKLGNFRISALTDPSLMDSLSQFFRCYVGSTVEPTFFATAFSTSDISADPVSRLIPVAPAFIMFTYDQLCKVSTVFGDRVKILSEFLSSIENYHSYMLANYQILILAAVLMRSESSDLCDEIHDLTDDQMKQLFSLAKVYDVEEFFKRLANSINYIPKEFADEHAMSGIDVGRPLRVFRLFKCSSYNLD